MATMIPSDIEDFNTEGDPWSGQAKSLILQEMMSKYGRVVGPS
jgi:hypothetical protein